MPLDSRLWNRLCAWLRARVKPPLKELAAGSPASMHGGPANSSATGHLTIANKAQKTLRIMIEPSAQSYDVPSGCEVVVRGKFTATSGEIEVVAYDDNFLAVWVVCDAIVSLDGKVLKPLKDD